MADITHRIDSGFLDDLYSRGTISQGSRRHNSSFEINYAEPSIDVATVDMVKNHYNISHNEDDVQIARAIETAVRALEDYTSRTIVERAVTIRYSRFTNEIVLPRPPHGAISSVNTIDDEGNETTLTLNDSYYVIGDKEKKLIVQGGLEEQLLVEFTAGYGTTLFDVPSAFQDAVIFQLGIYYKNFSEDLGTTVYDRGVRMDERAASAIRGYIYHGHN